MPHTTPPSPRPRVVIIGGGFAGLTCARALARAPVSITLLDQRNHHLFQPLLYQVATAALSPAQIAHPIRATLERQANATVLLAAAERIDLERKVVVLAQDSSPVSREIPFDYLVLAAGVTHSYFGHDEWSPYAPGLKDLDDALEIRRRFLLAFERAERLTDPEARRRELTFVVVGGGPTGVEMAGAMIEIALKTMPKEFCAIDTRTARVILVEAVDRLLSGGFPAELSRRALRDLTELGVDVRLNTRVTAIDAEGVTLEPASSASAPSGLQATPAKPHRVATSNVIWAAGVRANPLAASLSVPLDRAGRVLVEKDLSIPGHPEVLVAGDLAHVLDPKGTQVPGMAPGAMQMGRHAARVIRLETQARARGESRPPRAPFRYIDKGTLATIGRARAVAFIKGLSFGGLIAWLLWALIHVFYLIGFRTKVLVMLEWAWSYFFFERGSRLITGYKAGQITPARE